MDKQKLSEYRIVRFDWAIKNLLRNKANFDILEGFLSELLKQEIKVKSLLESESNKAYAEEKYHRIDLLVETANKEKIVIEIQAATQWDYYHRMLFGISKIVNEYINKGQSYDVIPKVISVNILFFDLGVGNDYVYVGKTLFHGMHTGDALEFSESSKRLYLNLDTNISNVDEMYIIQLKKFKSIVKDRFDQWVYLIKNGQIQPGFDAKGIYQTVEKLDEFKLSREERKQYQRDMEQMSHEASIARSQEIDMEIAKEKAEAIGTAKGLALGEAKGLALGEAKGLALGEAKGLARGKQEGINESKLEIAKKMKESGMPNVQISNITGLDLSEIEQL